MRTKGGLLATAHMLALSLSLLSIGSRSAATERSGRLTFEERLEAARAVEGVYRRHRIAGSEASGSVPSEDVLREKVLSYLAKSVALEEIWSTPVTREMLLAELHRIGRSTWYPERLEEIYGALGRDPLLVLECFARPVLVERLARSFFAFDRGIHAGARRQAERIGERLRTAGRPSVREERDAFVVEVQVDDDQERMRPPGHRVAKRDWDSWWSEVRGRLEDEAIRPVAIGDETLPRAEYGSGGAESPCEADDQWDNGSWDLAPVEGRWQTAVWTGTHMILWGGLFTEPPASTPITYGVMYDPLTDTWSNTTAVNAPEWRIRATAVWTGSEMIVWGGDTGGVTFLGTGGRYDPDTDTWTATSTVGAPSPRSLHGAVWTGSEMIVWGGSGGGAGAFNTGGRYDPVSDTWTATSTVGAPQPLSEPVALWTGSEMLIWKGSTGGRYDPVSDAWGPISASGAPAIEGPHPGVWTGDLMVVWGVTRDASLNRISGGGRYDPVTDSWLPVSSDGAPFWRFSATAVWTGSEMIVWGGEFGVEPSATSTGGRYDPVTDRWEPTSYVNAPEPRHDHTAIWTGARMIVWGGVDFTANVRPLGTGGRYDPATDSWTPTSATNSAPMARRRHTAVWTGSEMIVWGGLGRNLSIASGGIWDPLTDSWRQTPMLGAPEGRMDHAAVWTGSRMIVWGGIGWDGSATGWQAFDSGGIFDPVSEIWQPMSRLDAPSPRREHGAVWTGNEMVVWGGGAGGITSNLTPLGDGARYDPAMDMWTPLAGTGAPTPRFAHTTVWDGQEMIVWGGNLGNNTPTPTGGRYDPALDAWTETSQEGTPAPRFDHTAVWADDAMVVWGGRNGPSGALDTGALYDPVDDAWTPLSTTNAPGVRWLHSALWTGDLMVVWGGTAGGPTAYQSGGRWSRQNTWTRTSRTGAPKPRWSHTAVWTGEAMLVWGGSSGVEEATGGRYAVVPGPDADLDGFRACVEDCDDLISSVHPGAFQACGDGLNNDCGHPSWPALAGTNEADDDGDTLSECQGDCDDANGAAWGTPGEATNLDLLSDTMTLHWDEPLAAGGTVLRYDTVRSAGSDFMASGVCVESNGGDMVTSDPFGPGIDGIFYYLVGAENGCPGLAGQGPAGTDSSGQPIPVRDCP